MTCPSSSSTSRICELSARPIASPRVMYGSYLSVPGQDDPQEYEETEHDHIGVVLPIGIELRLPAVPRLGLNAQILPGYAIVDRPGFVGGAFVGARWWF